MRTVREMLVFNIDQGLAVRRGRFSKPLTFTNLPDPPGVSARRIHAPRLPSAFQVAPRRSLTHSQPRFPHP